MDALREQLCGLNLTGYSTADVTETIKQSIESWADRQGWPHDREAQIDHQRIVRGRCGRTKLYDSFVDLKIERPGEPDLFIEIDSSDKRISLIKLIACAHRGAGAIWVRFGRGCRLPVPDEIDVIEVPWRRPRRSRS